MITVRAAGWGDGWWRVDGRFVVSDGLRLWGLTPGGPRVWALPRVLQVFPDGPGLRVVVRDGRGFATIHLPVDGDPRREPPGDRVRDAEGETWIADGFVYRRRGAGTRAIDALGAGERAFVGPAGVVVVLGRDGLRVGAPGRTPRPVGPGDVAGMRIADDGAAVVFAVSGGLVRYEPLTGARRPAPGPAVTPELFLVDGWPRGRGLRHGFPIRDASCARAGDLLAGPAGRVWDLATGRPLTPVGTVFAGFTVAVGTAFVTWEWTTGRGHTISAAGATEPFQLTLAEDDAVRAVAVADDAVLVATSGGAGFRIARGRVTPVPEPPLRRPRRAVVDTPVGPFPDAQEHTVGPWRWVWNDDGWLVGFPAPPVHSSAR